MRRRWKESKLLPYGKQTIDEDDIQSVVDVLRSDWLTTGPLVNQLETAFSAQTQAFSATAVSNGTAALQAALHAIDIQPGDEVIVPAITFCATANAVIYHGGTPVFADIIPEHLLIDVDDVARKINSKTRAIIAVDYAGQPCHYTALRQLADEFNLFLIADACHSLGANYQQQPVGSLADLSCFSFHPVKPITCGEGGMVTVNTPGLKQAESLTRRLRSFRNHGIDSDHRTRQTAGQYEYDMQHLGFNLRLSDIQCALALSQLSKLDAFTARRQEIASEYHRQLSPFKNFTPLAQLQDRTHAYHLMVIRCRTNRDHVFNELRQRQIIANVHYRPVYQHSFYRQRFDTSVIECPQAELAYREILSLPIFPSMEDTQIKRVCEALSEMTPAYAKSA